MMAGPNLYWILVGVAVAAATASCAHGFAIEAVLPTVKSRTCSLPALTIGNEIQEQVMSTSPETSVVVVKRNRQSMEFRNGSPLVFEGAIAYTLSSSSAIRMGEWVRVEVEMSKSSGKNKAKPPHHLFSDDFARQTQDRQVLGWGVFNPHSLYRVRILCHASLHPDWCRQLSSSFHDPISLVVMKKLQAAMWTRTQLLRLPNSETDSFRMVNGEGDGLSGLAVDILGGQVAVVMSSAAWCEVHRATILNSLTNVLQDHYVDGIDIVWKVTPSRLKQDGYDDDDEVDDARSNALQEARVVPIKELGITYQSFPYEIGQKTGFYCDQRENRWNLASHCDGKRVLDLCCYHGGFALNAKVNGNARFCVGVDSSGPAIANCIANAQLNGVRVLGEEEGVDPSDQEEEGVMFVQQDISQFTKNCRDEFDVIVLDPPKLAPTVSGLARASRKYAALNRDALRLISKERGGLFLTCTCSAAMKQKDGGQYFLKVVQEAALSAGRVVTLLSTSGAASCHTQNPSSYPAGAYLTAALFSVAPTTVDTA